MNLNEQLKAMSLEYLGRLYDMHGYILDAYNNVFGQELKFDQQRNVFVGSYDNFGIVVTRNHDEFFIKATVVDSGNEIVAEAGINVRGKYSETFTRLTKDSKMKIAEWFDAISNSDTMVMSNNSKSMDEDVEEATPTVKA